jgi:hypothetical protein
LSQMHSICPNSSTFVGFFKIIDYINLTLIKYN